MRGGRRSRAASGSRRVIYAGIAGNVLVTLTKFGAAAVTHSAAMLSEAVHSLVDTFNDVLTRVQNLPGVAKDVVRKVIDVRYRT